MKRIHPILLLAFLFIYMASCEKDDICVDGDTPLLVIGFFDAENPEEHKRVPSLRIKSIDNGTVLSNQVAFRFNDRATSPDSLFVPLRTHLANTQFEFISDSADDADTDEETGNVDVLTISYTTTEVFISRACGFVANYEETAIDLPDSAENWIKEITIVQPKVENSDNIHVKIFH